MQAIIKKGTELLSCLFPFFSLEMRFLLSLIILLTLSSCTEDVPCDVEEFIWKDGVSYKYTSAINDDEMLIHSRKVAKNEWDVTESIKTSAFGSVMSTKDSYRLIKKGCKLIEKRASISYPSFIFPRSGEERKWVQIGQVDDGENVRETQYACSVTQVSENINSSLVSFSVSCDKSNDWFREEFVRTFERGKGLTKFTYKIVEEGKSKVLWDFRLGRGKLESSEAK